MIDEQIKILAEKVADGIATPEEELALLREMNRSVEALRTVITSIKEQK